MANISVIGTGYVGLVTGVCFAHLGHRVVGLDIDTEKILKLRQGVVPIYEPGLKEMLLQALENESIEFTSDYKEAVESSDFVFVAVGTPSRKDGSTDLSYVESAYKSIAKHLDPEHPKVIVNKSTVPVGTGRWAKEFISDLLRKRGLSEPEKAFDIVSNPEFLREGKAVEDFMHPDRIVVGAENPETAERVAKLYEKLKAPVLLTNLPTAEMIKYASNAFLATKISFINEIANICERVGADVTVVAKGMGLDHRISPYFLNAGCGFGGSCFPKDVKALIHTAKTAGVEPLLLSATINVNERQKLIPVEKLLKHIPDLKGKTVAVWGLAFKPGTDDMREAPSIAIINRLLELGATVKAYDPVAGENARRIFAGKKNLTITSTKEEALEGAVALILVTEWKEFENLDFNTVKDKIVIDGRNLWAGKDLQGYAKSYTAIGCQSEF